MARTALSYSNLVANGSLTEPAGTTLNAGSGNGHVIAKAEPERTILRVANTTASIKTVTVKAGQYPPAWAAGQGDLTVSLAANTGVAYIGPFESGRFVQKDGSLLVDVEAAMTGTIIAFLEPKAQ